MATKMILALTLLHLAMSGNIQSKPTYQNWDQKSNDAGPAEFLKLLHMADDGWQKLTCKILHTTTKVNPSQNSTRHIMEMCGVAVASNQPEANQPIKEISDILLEILNRNQTSEDPNSQATSNHDGSQISPTLPEFISGVENILEMMAEQPQGEPAKQLGVPAAAPTKSAPGKKPSKMVECAREVYELKSEYVGKAKGIKEVLKKSRKDYSFMGQRKYGFETSQSTSWNVRGISMNSVVKYDSDIVNPNGGGALDLKTGLFRAPINGIYHFSFHAAGYGVKDDASKTFIMVVSIVKVDDNEKHPVALAEGRIETLKNPEDLHQIFVQATVQLHKGEKVGVHLEKGWIRELNSEGTRMTSFTGLLIKSLKKLAN